MIYHHGSDDFVGLEAHCRTATRTLRPLMDEFDAIVTQGISGQCVAFIVGARMKVPVMVLRKGESRHGKLNSLVNQKVAMGARVLFLDDFISGGNTLQRCNKAVKAAGGTIVASYEYAPFGERYKDPKKIPGRYRDREELRGWIT